MHSKPAFFVFKSQKQHDIICSTQSGLNTEWTYLYVDETNVSPLFQPNKLRRSMNFIGKSAMNSTFLNAINDEFKINSGALTAEQILNVYITLINCLKYILKQKVKIKKHNNQLCYVLILELTKIKIYLLSEMVKCMPCVYIITILF